MAKTWIDSLRGFIYPCVALARQCMCCFSFHCSSLKYYFTYRKRDFPDHIISVILCSKLSRVQLIIECKFSTNCVIATQKYKLLFLIMVLLTGGDKFFGCRYSTMNLVQYNFGLENYPTRHVALDTA